MHPIADSVFWAIHRIRVDYRDIRGAYPNMDHATALALAARHFLRSYPQCVERVLDTIGSWPSSEPELRALQ